MSNVPTAHAQFGPNLPAAFMIRLDETNFSLGQNITGSAAAVDENDNLLTDYTPGIPIVLEIQIDGVPVQTVASGDTFSIPAPTGLAEGIHTLTVTEVGESKAAPDLTSTFWWWWGNDDPPANPTAEDVANAISDCSKQGTRKSAAFWSCMIGQCCPTNRTKKVVLFLSSCDTESL